MTRATVTTIQRQFEFEGKLLADPNPKLTPDQVRQHYCTAFPSLTNAAIKGPERRNGKDVYILDAHIGRKG